MYDVVLSIVIPIYNGERMVEECLNSIIKDTDSKDVEILVVNDGSTDGTKAILERISQGDERIKVFNNTNHGVSYSRNYALNKAVGKYIMFVDADDYLSEGWFEIIKEDFDKNFDIVYYCKQDIDYNITKEEVIKNIMCLSGGNNYFCSPCSKLIRKEIIGDLRFSDTIINGEDMLFNLKLILKADKYHIRDKSFYNYRVYEGSSTKRFNPKIVNSDKEFHKQLEEILKSSNLNIETQEAIKERCFRNAILTLVTRFSYIKSYKEAKNEFKSLEEEPYKYFIKNAKYDKKKKKTAFILLCCKFKLYFILFYMLKIYNKIKSKNKVSESFIRI